MRSFMDKLIGYLGLKLDKNGQVLRVRFRFCSISWSRAIRFGI
jgi:hypothetical protein